MQRRYPYPMGSLWDFPDDLLCFSGFEGGWFPIDGIPSETGSRKHHQLLFLGRADKVWGEIDSIFKKTGRHLGLQPSQWEKQRSFFTSFSGAFLIGYWHCIVWVQVLPRRKTFRTLHVDRAPGQPQKVISTPTFHYHTAAAPPSTIDLRYNLRIPSVGLRIDDEAIKNCYDDEPFWTSVGVMRSVAGKDPINEYWYFAAHPQDREKIQRTGSVPVLEQFFANQVQEAPLISFCALHPSGRVLQTHCLSLHPGSGFTLDIRQSRPTLEYHCRSAPHNHSGLGRLIYGPRWCMDDYGQGS